MNQDILQGRWEQLKGKARIKWGKSRVNNPIRIPTSVTPPVPVMRRARGMRRQAVAAHSANALHMLIE